MYNKEGKIKLETSANYVPIGNTNITFYDSDIGTADLIFYITRNQQPLEVSDENVDCFLMLKAKDGTYIVDTAHVVDPLNGKVKYTIPKEFLTHTGSVKGQVWITVHGKEDMITEVEFSFTIKDSMFTTIPAVDKVNYIRTFEDLRERIEDRVQYIEESLANGDDYVTQMDDTFQSGMKSLNDRSSQVISEINALADNYRQELNDLKDNSVEEINNKAIQAKESIEELNQKDTTNWQKHKLTQDDGTLRTIANFDFNNIDDYLTKSEMIYATTPVNGPELVSGYVGFKIRGGYGVLTYQPWNSENIYMTRKIGNDGWSKWKKITNDNTRQWLGTLGSEASGYNSVLDLPPGLYEATIPSDAWTVDAPQSMNGSDYIAAIDVYEGNGKRKQIRLVQNQYNYEFLATVHTENVDNPNGRFMGWKRVMNAEEFEAKNNDTGWINWEVMNDAVPLGIDQETSIRNQYRVITTNGVKKCYLRVYVNNITTQMTIGSIPKGHVPKVQNFYVRTPVTMNPAVLVADVDGQLKVYLNTNDTAKWQPGHYIIGEVSWIIDDVGAGI
ncbi:phage baseplate upper protein [Staphylococcus sp. 11-B-312]|uniref:phage baseplate upper protein n=1 Tax=Staphylococcus sp. 11-B-312 TaxID=2799680 RepID=UPI00193A6486|nr:phage baseplate upper protein [Staphylococcus sp. 11-B-312]QQV52223.1 BppU family phage baseplate upper protein [Staphylococcus sp. 11-B-312]